MGYGLGVFLIALGLILAFAVTDMISNVDLTMVGWIIALAGVLIARAHRGADQLAAPRHLGGHHRRTRTAARPSPSVRTTTSDPPPAV